MTNKEASELHEMIQAINNQVLDLIDWVKENTNE